MKHQTKINNKIKITPKPKIKIKTRVTTKQPNSPKYLAYKINNNLKLLEIFSSAIFWCWFVVGLVVLRDSCIIGVCRDIPSIDGNLYNTILKYILPFFGLVGTTRLGLNFFANQSQNDDKLHLSFYVGLIGLYCCYFLFGLHSTQFLFFYGKSELIVDSTYITWELVLLFLSSVLLFRTKRVWDKSTFFVKTRVMYYFCHLVIMVLNLNLGILCLLVFVPLLIYSDCIKKTNYNWTDRHL